MSLTKYFSGVLGVALAVTAGASAAESAQPSAESPHGAIRLDETVISGNQELPKVLYIVPWQQPEGLPDLDLESGIPDAELFRRLYPPAYRRELSYHQALQDSLQEPTE